MALWEIPSNVEIRHFNDIRGLNHFKDVPCIIIIGRAKEREQDTEDLAEAMAVRDPKVIAIQRQAGRDKVKAWADRKGRRTLAMTDGRKASVPCEAHPDPTVNQYMGRAGEEVLQAVNRMRAYDRTAASCCDVHVFGQFDTGLQVHEVCTQRDSEVDVFDLMRAQGVVLEGGESIEAAFPGVGRGGGGQGRAMLAVSKRRIRTWAEERYEIQIGNSTSRLPIERLYIGSRDNERLWSRVVFRRLGPAFFKDRARRLEPPFCTQVGRRGCLARDSLVREHRPGVGDQAQDALAVG